MKLRYFFLALALAVITVVSIAGFRGDHFTKPPFEVFPDMNYQDKVKDQQPSAFFADGNSARAPIPGTVAEEMPAVNDYWATGKWDDTHWGDGIPVHDGIDGGRPLQIDAENMARGRERYTISCEVCHGAAGDGKGITSKYGLNGAASYQTDRLRQDPDGDIFNTITNGHGQMLGYGYNITIDDRWRIVMYIRALQKSQNAMVADASPAEQAQLQATAKPAAPAPAPAAPSQSAPSTPAPAKPAGSAMNENNNGQYYNNKNTSGHFSFDVGYEISPKTNATPCPKGPLKLDYGVSYNDKSASSPEPSPAVPAATNASQPLASFKSPATTTNQSQAQQQTTITFKNGEKFVIKLHYGLSSARVQPVPASAQPAGSASNETNKANRTDTASTSYPSYMSSSTRLAVVYLCQSTMKGWVDQMAPYIPNNETGSNESPTK